MSLSKSFELELVDLCVDLFEYARDLTSLIKTLELRDDWENIRIERKLKRIDTIKVKKIFGELS